MNTFLEQTEKEKEVEKSQQPQLATVVTPADSQDPLN